METRSYVLYDARDSHIYWPPMDMARREASTRNHRLALTGRPEMWILRDALTLHLMANGARTASVN